MDVEAIVKKHLNAWRVSTVVSPESCIRAALTEMAAEYDRKQALLLEAHCERVGSLQERIRQMDAWIVPKRFLSDVITAAVLLPDNCADKGLSERLRIGAFAMLTYAPQPKEGE